MYKTTFLKLFQDLSMESANDPLVNQSLANEKGLLRNRCSHPRNPK